MFISLDGVDGVGKSTQAARLSGWLAGTGRDVVRCRDPGSTKLGEAVRRLVLDHSATPIGCRAEMLLYMAARAQLVDEVIRPALAAGKTVLSDRYLLANVVYQAYGGGLDVETVWQVGRVAIDGLMPDLVIVLDMPAADATARLTRDLDRMERRGDAYREKLRQGFLQEAARDPKRIVVVDAAREPEIVEAEVRTAVEALFDRTNEVRAQLGRDR